MGVSGFLVTWNIIFWIPRPLSQKHTNPMVCCDLIGQKTYENWKKHRFQKCHQKQKFETNNWCFGEIFEWFLDFLEKKWKIQWSVSERNRSMPSGKCSIFVGFDTNNHHHEDRRVENHPMLRGSQPAGNHTFGHLGWKETPSTGKSQPAHPNNLEY